MRHRGIRTTALAADRGGIAAVEYALICLMLSTMLIVMFPTLRGGLGAAFHSIVGNLTTASGG